MAEPPEGVEDESPRCLEVIGASSNSSQQCFVKRGVFLLLEQEGGFQKCTMPIIYLVHNNGTICLSV